MPNPVAVPAIFSPDSLTALGILTVGSVIAVYVGLNLGLVAIASIYGPKAPCPQCRHYVWTTNGKAWDHNSRWMGEPCPGGGKPTTTPDAT